MEAPIRSEITVHFYYTLWIYNPKVCNIRTCAQNLVPLTPFIISPVFFLIFSSPSLLSPFHGKMAQINTSNNGGTEVPDPRPYWRLGVLRWSVISVGTR